MTGTINQKKLYCLERRGSNLVHSDYTTGSAEKKKKISKPGTFGREKGQAGRQAGRKRETDRNKDTDRPIRRQIGRRV